MRLVERGRAVPVVPSGEDFLADAADDLQIGHPLEFRRRSTLEAGMLKSNLRNLPGLAVPREGRQAIRRQRGERQHRCRQRGDGQRRRVGDGISQALEQILVEHADNDATGRIESPHQHRRRHVDDIFTGHDDDGPRRRRAGASQRRFLAAIAGNESHALRQRIARRFIGIHED